MGQYLLERLKEPSSWRAAIWIATSFGLVTFSADQSASIVALGMCLSGAVGVITPDKLH